MLQLWEPLDVPLCGRRVFADVMQLRVLRCGDDTVLSGRNLNAITSVLVKKRPRQS